ncbi:MAG: DUF4123 domain-containing protein [Sedimentitalea sp.]
MANHTRPTPSIDAFQYAVVDLASAVDLRHLVMGLRRSVAVTLFARDAPRAVVEVGPFLVRLSEAPDVERSISSFQKDLPWGYFVHSTFDLLSLRHSLRRFNLVRLSDPPKEVLFRYWDPRVIRTYLEIATKEQRARLFEIIDRIETADGFVARNN